MTKEASGWPVVLIRLVACLAILGGKSTAMADKRTIVIENNTGVEIIPRIIAGNPSTGSMDHAAVRPKGMTTLYPKGDNDFALFFAYNCSRDSSGHLMNCRSGDCPEGSCTRASGPVATSVEFVKNDISLSVLNGYNFAVDIEFECNGCACPSISCAIPLSECPEELRISDESGLPTACRAGIGQPSCQDYSASNSDSPSSVSTTCSFKNVIIKVRVSVRK